MNIYHLRRHLAFIRRLIMMHCKTLDELKKTERWLMSAIATAESGAVAAAVARVGESAWQRDGERCQN